MQRKYYDKLVEVCKHLEGWNPQSNARKRTAIKLLGADDREISVRHSKKYNLLLFWGSGPQGIAKEAALNDLGCRVDMDPEYIARNIKAYLLPRYEIFYQKLKKASKTNSKA